MVAYAEKIGPSWLFVFPQLADKAPFLLQLFQKHLPNLAPELFPSSTQLGWLKSEWYLLPNEARLLKEKQALEEEHAQKIQAKQQEIDLNYTKYLFLHELLTETGDKLVKAVEHYLRWLGFLDVVNCDEALPGRNEEDLQVTLEQGVLLIEVKGIGGTSKDSECAQVEKYKHRREKERNAFDVFALYIVNHQRYLPPESRDDPPFTDQQVQDAQADQRGLLTPDYSAGKQRKVCSVGQPHDMVKEIDRYRG